MEDQTTSSFIFWYVMCKFEILMFERDHCELNFTLHAIVLEKVIALLFIAIHYSHAWWYTAHRKKWLWQKRHVLSKNMAFLPKPLLKEFLSGHWVDSKTQHFFLALPIDKVHENLKKMFNAEGVIGITGSKLALERWILTSPDMICSILQFKMETNIDTTLEKDIFHHEDGVSFKLNFF